MPPLIPPGTWFALFFFALLMAPPTASAHHVITPRFSLLSDGGFWAMLGLFVLAASLAIWFFYALLTRISRPYHCKGRVSWRAGIVFAFAFALLYQTLHQIEHVAQEFEFWYLEKSALESPGILWFLNIEWNHWTFNFLYLIALIYVFVAIYLEVRFHTPRREYLILLGIPLLAQGWHMVEHMIKIVRHTHLGCEPCKGVLDVVLGVPLPHLHFWFNALVLILPSVLFFWYGFHISIFNLIEKGKRNLFTAPPA